MKYQLICEWCGLPFYSNRPHTRFCSGRCANLFLKEKNRQLEIEALEMKISAQHSDLRLGFQSKDLLSTSEAAKMLGVHPDTVVRYTKLGMLNVIKLPGKNLFKKTDIEKLMSSEPQGQTLTMDTDLSEYTTVVEASRYYNVSRTSLCNTLENNGISPIVVAGTTFFKKSDIRSVYGKLPQKDTLKITEWATHEQIEFEYRMTRTAVTAMLRELSIPSKKEHRVTYFSLNHLRARRQEQLERFNAIYYTVPQIMDKYFLTDMQVYKILARYNVRHFKKGTTISIVKNEWDKVFDVTEFTL